VAAAAAVTDPEVAVLAVVAAAAVLEAVVDPDPEVAVLEAEAPWADRKH
jgi:hypothetical protein